MKQAAAAEEERFRKAMGFLASFTDFEQLLHVAPRRDIFDLGRLERLLARLGHPERRRPVVHVTGTKGKSSVVFMTEALLRAHGQKTFRFLSPHVERVHERLAVAGKPISSARFASLVECLIPEVERLKEEAPQDLPSFFEATTVMGFLLAREAGTQVSVLEVGLGGRLDATNVVDPTISLITGVALDHTRILGTTLVEIAAEKAGIIKRDRPAATLVPPENPAFKVLAKRARNLAAPLWHPPQDLALLDIQSFLREDGGPGLRFSGRVRGRLFTNLELHAGPDHQAWNALLALLAAGEVLHQEGQELRQESAAKAFSKLRLPARSEWFQGPPPLLLDGAHTRESVAALAKTALRLAAGRPIHLICGLTRDRSASRVLSPLLPLVTSVMATSLPSPRGMPPERLAAALKTAGAAPRACPRPEEALQETLAAALEDGGLVLVAGSLYLAGTLRPFLRHLACSRPLDSCEGKP